VWEFVIDCLGMSGDPPYVELVSRIVVGASELTWSSDQGLGIMCWAHPTEHLWRVQVPFGEVFLRGPQRSLAGNTCNRCRSRTVLTDTHLDGSTHLGNLRTWVSGPGDGIMSDVHTTIHYEDGSDPNKLRATPYL